MNERIKELAKQAGMYIVDDEYSSGGRFAEKFSQLIVQECSNFLKDILDDHFAAEQLEDHFGVE
jgi:hypothetical protein